MELHHVLTRAAWDAAQAAGVYAPPELARDGFLHCCTSAQLDFVMAKHFAGATGLLVLTFETDDVPGRLEWADSEPGQRPFPHLFGPIALKAVRGTKPV